MKEIYDYLRRQYIQEHIHVDDYEGQNKTIRLATLYAVRNTRRMWEAQSNG